MNEYYTMKENYAGLKAGTRVRSLGRVEDEGGWHKVISGQGLSTTLNFVPDDLLQPAVEMSMRVERGRIRFSGDFFPWKRGEVVTFDGIIEPRKPHFGGEYVVFRQGMNHYIPFGAVELMDRETSWKDPVAEKIEEIEALKRKHENELLQKEYDAMGRMIDFVHEMRPKWSEDRVVLATMDLVLARLQNERDRFHREKLVDEL